MFPHEQSNWLAVKDVVMSTDLRENTILHSGRARSTLSSKFGEIPIINFPGLTLDNTPVHVYYALRHYDQKLRMMGAEREGEWLKNGEAMAVLGLSASFMREAASRGKAQRERISVPPGYIQRHLWLYWVPGVERVMYPDDTLRFIIHPDLSLDGRLRSVVYDLDAILPADV